MTHYTLELEHDSDMLHTVIVGSITMRYTFIEGIRPRTTYELRIKARSEAQEGHWANLTLLSGYCKFDAGNNSIDNKGRTLIVLNQNFSKTPPPTNTDGPSWVAGPSFWEGEGEGEVFGG